MKQSLWKLYNSTIIDCIYFTVANIFDTCYNQNVKYSYQHKEETYEIHDFFADAPPVNAKSDWHKVDDVQYCIDQCNDYIHGAGDFFDYAHPEMHLEVTEYDYNSIS